MKRVLSIDGGGIRGLIPALVCQRIEEWSGARVNQMFDLIAGTSTGGIIAMGLAVPPEGKPAQQLVEFYKTDCFASAGIVYWLSLNWNPAFEELAGRV